MRRDHEARGPARRHVDRRREDVAGQHRPGLDAPPRPDDGCRGIDAQRVGHADRSAEIARSGILHQHAIRAVPVRAGIDAVWRRDLVEQQVGAGGRHAARRLDAGDADAEIVARIGIAAPAPVQPRHIGDAAIVHQRLGQRNHLVQHHAVAGVEQHRPGDALIGRRSGRGARPWRLRPEAHAGAGIAGRQVVVDHHRAPIGHHAGVLDPDGEVAQPVGARIGAEERLGPLFQRQVAIGSRFAGFLMRRPEAGRHVTGRRQHRRRHVALRRVLAALPDRHRADMPLGRRLIVGGIAIVIGEE